MGLRVFVGKRTAIVSSNDPRESPEALAERAVAFARLAPDNPFASLADTALLAHSFPDLDLLDPVLADVAVLEKRAIAAEAAMLAAAGVKSGGVSASSSLNGFALITSHGFSGSVLQSSHSVSAMAISGEGTGMERDYDYDAKVHAADLDDPATIGTKAAERALRRRGPRKVETCRVPVLFEARAAGSLVSHLTSAINGASVARKTSFLREKMGAQLFKPGITIIDDPLRPRGLASRPFDGEGVAQASRAVIEDGRLTTWLLDVASAQELGLTSTGHASRSASSPPSPAATNVHLKAGTTSPADMIKAIGTGLYVTDMIGHGVNPVTGDYSRGCSGFWIEKGELAFPSRKSRWQAIWWRFSPR